MKGRTECVDSLVQTEERRIKTRLIYRESSRKTLMPLPPFPTLSHRYLLLLLNMQQSDQGISLIFSFISTSVLRFSLS